MNITISMENLTEEQLEALKVINAKAVEEELERRNTYTDEDMAEYKVYSDLYKAYFYLKPMYDNMRNSDIKKTIAQSEILPVLEKIFRWTKKHGIDFKKFEEPVVEPTPTPVVEPIPAEPTPVVEPTPTPAMESTPVPTEQPLSDVEGMNQEELNKILASIPQI